MTLIDRMCPDCVKITPSRKLHDRANDCEDHCNVEEDEICDTEVCIECGATTFVNDEPTYTG